MEKNDNPPSPGSSAVIYRSRYGSSRQYAQWIATELGADLYETHKVSVKDLQAYDTLIFGGGLYANKILGINFLKKNFEQLNDSRIIVFSVGTARPDAKNLTGISQANLSEHMRREVHFFHLRGAIDYPNMRWPHRLLMWLVKKHIERTPGNERSIDEQDILDYYGTRTSFLSQDSIQPLIAAARGER